MLQTADTSASALFRAIEPDDFGNVERRYLEELAPKLYQRGSPRCRVLADLEIESVALPLLGCGFGGLRWTDVRPRIERALGTSPVRVLVFEPQAALAPEQMPQRRARPRMTAFRATLVWLLSRYLAPGEATSPLEVQKLLYFH